MPDSLTIDGVGPMPVERPGTVAELCAIVRRCSESMTAIYPVGGGTMLDYGMPPARPGIALSTTALNRIIDYPARDLTITVEAGVTMEKLQEVLAAENQWLPIDIPLKSTIGGAIACDVSGPRRYGYGTLRDYIIGITVVNDRGEECKAGGRVVKNVAGYDMMKLHTGALGTLGVITQVTLRVKPKPEKILAATLNLLDRHVADAFSALERTQTRPSWVHTANLPALTQESWDFGTPYANQTWCMQIAFDGTEEAVSWQANRLTNELVASEIGHGSYEAVSMSDESRCNSERYALNLWRGSSICRARLAVSRGETAKVCLRANLLGYGHLIIAYPGTILVHFVGDKHATPSVVSGEIASLVEDTFVVGANAVLDCCPTEWKSSLPLWGHPPADLALQKAVKRALDPHNLFNPGRFVTDCF